MSPAGRHPRPHIHPNTFDYVLPPSYFEGPSTPCPCTTGLPFHQDLEQEILRLRHREADLEDWIRKHYETMAQMHEENTVLRRAIKDTQYMHQCNQNTQTSKATRDSHYESQPSNPSNPTTPQNRVPAAIGLRQITTELSLLSLQSQTELLTSRIVGLENKFVLLADEIHDHGKCITLLAEAVGGAQMERSEKSGSESEVETDEFEEEDGEALRVVRGDGDGDGVGGWGMRGGMGGRDEDEEFVYGFRGYVNWEQVDDGGETYRSQSREMDIKGGNGEMDNGEIQQYTRAGNEDGEQGTQQVEVDIAHISELQRQIERLEEQIERLRGTLSAQSRAALPPVSQTPSNPADESTRDTTLHLRGGSDRPSSTHNPVQHPLPSSPNLSQDFANAYTNLLHRTTSSSPHHPPSDCTHAWINLATVLQLRNAFLERELKEYKEICDSLMSDVRWQMGTQVELEELCEEMEKERDVLLEEVGVLRRGLRGGDVSSKRVPRSATTDVGTTAGTTGTARSGPDVDGEIEITPSSTLAAEPSTSHIPFTSFTYHPQLSHITFPTTPPQIYHFPSAPTLPLIYAALEYRQKHIGEDDPYLVRVREILEIREAMGISLPKVFGEEAEVEIGIPDLFGEDWDGEEVVSREIEIAAWKSAEEGVGEMEECVRRLGLDDDDADIEEEGSGSEYGDPVSDTATSGGGTCSFRCCCTEEERRGHLDTLGSTKAPTIAIRGGGSEHDGRFYDSDDESESETGRSGCGWKKDTSPRSSKGIGVPPNSPLAFETSTQNCRRASSAVSPECCTTPTGSRSPRVTMSAFEEQLWRHPRGSGCEEWAYALDMNRQRCTFCDLPFSDNDPFQMSSSIADVRHEDDAQIPTSISAFPYPERSDADKNNLDGTNDDPESVVYLRGGGAWSDISDSVYSEHSDHNEDWRSEWNDLATQTHRSNHQHPVFRNSNSLSTKEVEKPPTPITRHKSQPRLNLPSLYDEHGNKRYNLWYISYGGLKLGTEDAVQDDEEDVYHSKIPQRSFQRDQRLDADEGVRSKQPPAAGRRIPSNVVTGGFRKAWFENPRPAPPIPATRRDVKTKASFRGRLSKKLSLLWHVDKDFVASLESRVSKEIPTKPGRRPTNTSRRFPQSPGRTTVTPKRHLQFRVKMLLRRRRACIDKVFELSKPRPNVDVDAISQSAIAESTTESEDNPTKSVFMNEKRAGQSILDARGNLVSASQLPHSLTSDAFNNDAPNSQQTRGTSLPPKSHANILLLDKPLPPTPQSSLSTLPYLRGGGPKDPVIWTEAENITKLEECSLLRNAERIAAAVDLEIRKIAETSARLWVPPTISGPSDTVNDVLRVLKWKEKQEREGMADWWEAMEYEEKWRMRWVVEHGVELL
ncbi:hypothetical protein NX059_010816 [Plenodomus lindquistii]|nr:hypothetical protein NX059_010816 [Plenodomus lindquistii]